MNKENKEQNKLETQIHNLETIIQQKNFAPEDKQILLKEIARLKQALAEHRQG
jgi:uncharacterized coiled-coil DUF342 family protein